MMVAVIMLHETNYCSVVRKLNLAWEELQYVIALAIDSYPIPTLWYGH